MKLFKLNKISYRFIVPAIIVIIVSSIISTIFFTMFISDLVKTQRLKKEKELKTDIAQKTKLLALTSKNDLWNFNTVALKEMAEAFLAEKEVVQIIIQDSSGEEIINERSMRIADDEFSKLDKESVFKVKKIEFEHIIERNKDEIGKAKIIFTNYYLQQNLKSIKSDLIDLRNKLILMISFIFLLIVIGMWWISKRVTKPIVKATNFAQKIAQGNLKLNNLDISSEDEVGVLVRSLNEMKNNLDRVVSNLYNSIHLLSSSSEELTASAQQSTATVREGIGLLDEMTEQIDEIDKSSNEVTKIAVDASARAKEGNEYIQKTEHSINEINEEVLNAVEIMNILDSKMAKIDEIVEMITDIARETNLLALNASVEAARAGKSRKGFGVVADEISSLAQETSEATDDISAIIEKVQIQTKSGVKAIEKVHSKADKGKEITIETGKVFDEIRELINQTSDRMQEISLATEELTNSNQQVIDGSDGLNDMSREIANSAESLTEEAYSLQKLVDKFNV